ncbi:hypothetical protein BKA82DRAFT_936037 [Pisolithus tinctorius]|uniref:Uncharacterized protein n=1 Tax=Pisolithus tinctorius Marx 270 TaxID=870435 RepID=A0A0C3PJH1_PISTI|nr:hypothetical protein BKA82DRAFT_936037 [Pisolithus tinctorius]KIO08756.1 hypothetical protein M404DRAFT_936037 [Pisolithus tinctorius Marx 270]
MYLPGSFDIAPRDPSLHSNSWYKATEYITWIYGLCPALLYNVLPEIPWRNFCKFVAGLRIMSQYSITPVQLQLACQLLNEWEPEFEQIFYQWCVDCIPIIRPCVHLTCHLTSKRTIGNLGQEIHQPSDPFSNLAQQGIWRCQVNALKAMIPHLDPPKNKNPRASTDLCNSFVLLAKCDRKPIILQGEEARVIAAYLRLPQTPKVQHWACLQLPNGQIARSEFQELQKAPEDICMACNVKVTLNGVICIAEVRYFARLVVTDNLSDNDNDDEDLDGPHHFQFDDIALVTLYSHPHPFLLEQSHGVLASCMKLGKASLQVIKISAVQSVVAMVPHRPVVHGVTEDRYFLVEKTGMEIVHFGLEENDDE